MKNLFKSQTAYEILELLSSNEKKCFYLGEISEKLAKDSANVLRELKNLIKEDLVLVKKEGKKNYYQFNVNYEAWPELRALMQKTKNKELENTFNRDWLLAEEIVNANPWLMCIPFYSFTNNFVSPGGKAYKQMTSVYRGYHLWFYFEKKDAFIVGEHLVNKFWSNIDFMEEVNDKIREFAIKMNQVVDKVPESGLDKLSNDKLWKYYQAHEDVHLDYYRYGWIPVAADMFGDNLTNRGKKMLLELGVKENKVEEYLSILTQPDEISMLKEEHDNLVKIGIEVQKDPKQLKLFKDLFYKFKEEDVKFFGLYTHSEEYEKKFAEVVSVLKSQISNDIMAKLEEHYQRYFYTKYIYTEEQGVYSFEHYLKELVRLVSGDNNLAKTLVQEEKDRLVQIIARRNLVNKLQLSLKHQRFFAAWGDFMLTKIIRRYSQLFALYKTSFYLEEIASRLNISLKELRFMRSEEIKSALFGKPFDRDEIKKRTKLSLYYTAKDVEVYYSGKEAEHIIKKYLEKDEQQEISELKGQCGCRGYVKGVVKIVNVISDMSKMKQGDVLVSISTQPDLVPAMKKAAAFVTDQGGVTSHAAIVAREMKKPCVIATKFATKVLKDGDLVEVDADKGIVKLIKNK
jgi:phosphohistidine swiveling domain-containing protein/DNA-binding transcriptional ArsR family regulator